jgi:D-glycero-alpha-D-manno-heptose-7-phosphate kinase
MTNSPRPNTIINSVAPIRICDLGGWTDTWFAGHGRIFNIGVYPYADVQIAVYPTNAVEHRIIINAENFGERFVVDPEKHSSKHGWQQHPLLEAAIEYMNIPDNLAVEVTIFSDAPVGASTGTSAAVTVALLGGLDALTPGRMTPHEVALAAQKVETELLGQQCGIQDQLSSAYGGINYIEMHQYPYASVSPIHIPNEIWWELERRLVLIYLGKSHSSSAVHEMVIHSLENAGPDCAELTDLRQTAPLARDALFAGDFSALGNAMKVNTAAQQRLHPGLISAETQKIIEISRNFDVLGWKVNGAGGEGGSVTLLTGARSEVKRALIRAINAENPLFQQIPIYLSRYGLRVWQQNFPNNSI